MTRFQIGLSVAVASFALGTAANGDCAIGPMLPGLQRDPDGTWRSEGMRNGVSVPVYCDYQGNVGVS